MLDTVKEPILTPKETARHLGINERTMYRWLHEQAAGEPLVHSVTPTKQGHPNVPFVAVVEAYVLHSLRDLGVRLDKIRQAAEKVRNTFDEPYGLASQRIATDGVDIFVDYAGDLARAHDGQRPIREVIQDYLKYISWDDNYLPARLYLPKYEDIPVMIDPRYGWGTPVVEENKIQVDAILGLWQAGESLETVADEFDMTAEQVEAVCRYATAA
ncbi:DUF433 domain-containing protein [Streptomyces sp. NPDC058045]|uniref:DUF433 domain-containing protein n=1 Tax=Streptomyces sp. NPDC058045 TaxID=3346311 RepID=UPI0036ECCD5F